MGYYIIPFITLFHISYYHILLITSDYHLFHCIVIIAKRFEWENIRFGSCQNHLSSSTQNQDRFMIEAFTYYQKRFGKGWEKIVENDDYTSLIKKKIVHAKLLLLMLGRNFCSHPIYHRL